MRGVHGLVEIFAGSGGEVIDEEAEFLVVGVKVCHVRFRK